MKTKVCIRCGKRKFVDKFSSNKAKNGGLQKDCKVCHRKKRRDYYKKSYIWMRNGINEKRYIRREKNTRLLVRHLQKRYCVDCGERDALVLDFDHVRGKKLSEVTALVRSGVGWDRVEKEIKKCVVRCSNCHRRRTSAKIKTWRWKILQEMKSKEK
jgi:hypothetical protein